MSFTHYQALRHNAETQLKQPLAELTSAQLNSTSQELDTHSLKATINEFNAQCAWVMYRDAITTDCALTRDDVIEGEWFNGTDTLKVKLLSDNRYLVVTMSSHQSDTGAQLVKKQVVKTRFGTVQYALWFTQQNGRWQPIAQQFMGFVNKEVA